MTKERFLYVSLPRNALQPQCSCGVAKFYASLKAWHKNLKICQFLCQSPEKIRSILRRNDTTAKKRKTPQTQ